MWYCPSASWTTRSHSRRNSSPVRPVSLSGHGGHQRPRALRWRPPRPSVGRHSWALRSTVSSHLSVLLMMTTSVASDVQTVGQHLGAGQTNWTKRFFLVTHVLSITGWNRAPFEVVKVSTLLVKLFFHVRYMISK